MGILGTKPAPIDGLPRDAPRGREAERILAAELLAEFRAFQQTMTVFAERIAGRITNHVLAVATRQFDANGLIPLSFGAPAGAIEVTNLATAVAAGTTAPSPATTHPANPAAGAEISITVPAGQTWQLQDLDFTLTTSAAAANRQVQVIIDDGANEIWRFLVTITQAASLAYIYAFGGATNDAAVRAATGVNEVLSEMDLPGLTLGAGYRIRTSTINIQAGDQYSAITVAYTLASTVASAAHAITVMSGPPAGNVPTTGTGVYVVPAGQSRVIAVDSREVTLYGTNGDSVSYQVFTTGPIAAAS